MAKFIYEAKKSPTEIIKGEISADNDKAAIRKISQMGYYVISIEEEGAVLDRETSSSFDIFNKIGLKDTVDFTRQLADLMEAGLTVIRALDILKNQAVNKRFRLIITDIKEFCASGNSLSAAFSRHPRVFSNLFVSMVRSGEASGTLDRILRRLADFGEKQLEVRTKIRSALAYPALMAFVGIGTIVVLMTYVIPKMMVMFADLGQALPLPTQILLAASALIRNYWWVLIALAVASWAAFANIYKTKDGRLTIDRIVISMPIFGPLAKKVEIARFTRTLATLLDNGVPILESLRIVSDVVENGLLKAEIDRAYDAVREGSGLAAAFAGGVVVPESVLNIMAIGEEGGNLSQSLFKIAQGYERESDEAVKIMMSLLEPVLILILGAVVGFIVISMLLPIFEINFLMR